MNRPIARRSRGFTLVEMLITIVIGSIVVLGAVAVAGYQIRTLGVASQATDLGQVGRATLDLIADDLVNAGVGVGYRLDTGQFEGLPPFPVGSAMGAEDRVVGFAAAGGAIPTDDLLIATADGASATIVATTVNSVTLCGPGQNEAGFVTPNEDIVLRDAFGLAARAVRVANITVPVACPGPNLCAASGSCVQLDIAEVGEWASDADALDPVQTPLSTFLSGSVTGGFRQVVWYVEANGSNGRLRRGIGPGCFAAGALFGDSPNCGDIAAEGVESLQVQVLQLRAGSLNTWDVVDRSLPILSRQPLRVDIELVVRARSDDINQAPHSAAQLRSEPGVCLPLGCAPSPLRREVFRTSVEIKNSGYMALNGAT